MANFLQDLKYGVRLLARSPGFTLVATLSLALGIGANTTIFTLINAVLLNPLPLEKPSELVSVWTTDTRNTGGFNNYLQTSPLNYQDYRDKNQVFSGLVAHQFLPLSISGGTGEPEQIFGEIVSGNFFDVLGARPLVGRTFLPDEDKTPGARLVTVLGYGEWQKRFGGDPGDRRPDDYAERQRVHRRRHHAEGVQGHQFDRGARALGAVHVLPGDDERVLPGGRDIAPRARLQHDGTAEAGRLDPAGRGQPQDDRRAAGAGIPERQPRPQRGDAAALAGHGESRASATAWSSRAAC